MVEIGNLHIVGISTVAGGSYHKVKVLGELAVKQQLSAHHIKVVGTLDSHADVICDEVGVLGTMNANDLTVREQAEVVGTLTVDKIMAEDMQVTGDVSCRRELVCQHLKVKGAVTVDELLNAETVRIKSKNLSRVKEMGGRRIKVSSSFPFPRRVLRAELIEFDEINLKCTQAAVVRGKTVEIGEHCEIDLVEYSDKLIQHPRARIREVRKI